jgi:hypothetical protein
VCTAPAAYSFHLLVLNILEEVVLSLRTGQGSVFARVHIRSTPGASIVSRLHSRSITGRNLHIQVHQHFGRRLHLLWEYGSTGRQEVCAGRIFEMTDELYAFCKQIKEGGIERLCDCVLKGVV